MFSVLILAVFIGLANCQITPRSIETSYSEGKEYKYEYESQVLSGLPEGSKTVAGLKLKSSIILQKVSPYSFKLQLDSPRFYKINEDVDSVEPLKEMLSSDDMKELLDKDVETMKLHLCKPLTISYVKGHVSDLQTEEDDPSWSVNVKKAILSLFELNFNERQSLDRDVPVSGFDPQIYRVVEPSTVGECETRYRVEPERSDDDVPSITVQKIRDYDKCIDKVINTIDVYHGKPCHTCDKNWPKEHMSAQSSVWYKLLGSPDNFIIVNVESESHYNFAVYSERAGKLTSITKQELRLLDDRPISDPIDEPKSPLSHDRPLKVIMSDYTSSPMSPDKYQVEKEEQELVMEMVKKLLTGLDKVLEDKVGEESGELVLELGELVRKLDKESLDEILDALPPTSRSRSVLLDILPSLGTYSSMDVLFERIEKSELSPESAAMKMMALSLMPQPDVFIVKRLVDFIKSKDLEEEISHSWLRRSTWLTLGALGRKMSTVSKSVLKDIENELKVLEELRMESNDGSMRRKLDVRVEEVKNKETQMKDLYTTEKQNIIDMLKRLSAKDDKDSKLQAVKVMGSLGFKEFLPFLEPLLKDEDTPFTFKVEAVHCLKSIVKDDPEQVERILLPLSLDPKQPDVVRMLSIDAVLKSVKSKSAIELIVKSLEDRPNENIEHYLRTNLEQLSKLPRICDDMKSLAVNSTFARRYLSREPLSSPSKSRIVHSSSYDDRTRIGFTYSHSILFSPEQTTPSYLSTKTTAIILGKVTDIFELRYSGVGTDTIIDSLLEGSTDTSYETMLKSLLHPRNRRSPQFDPESMIRDIKEKIGVVPMFPKEINSHVSIHYVGHEMAYFDSDSMGSPSSDSRPPVEQDPKLSMPDSLKYKLGFMGILMKLMNVQKSNLQPLVHSSVITESGLPLKLKIDQVSIVKVDSNMRMEPDTHSFGKSPYHSKMEQGAPLVTVRPTGVVEYRCKMDVELKYLKSGISVKMSTLTDFTTALSFNMDQMKTKLNIKIRDEKKIIPYKFDVHTHTMIERIPSSIDQYPIPSERKEISVIDEADIKVISYEIGKETLGRNFKLVSELSVRKDSQVPMHPFAGRHTTYLDYEPNPDDDGFDIQLQHVKVDDDKDEDSSDRSWYSKLTSWWSDDSGDSTDSSDSSSEESSRESDEWDDEDEDFIDLESKDLTIDYLKRKFRKHTYIKESGFKCGVVIRIANSKNDKKHEVQWSTLYQKDPSKLKTSYTAELKARTDSGENIWKSVTDLKLDIPKMDYKPSDLFNEEYKRSILHDIRMYVKQDDEPVDSLIDLGSKILTQTIQKGMESESSKKHSEQLEDIINHVLDLYKPLDSESTDLKEIIPRQRKLLLDLKDLKKEVKNVEDVDESVKMVEEIMEKSKRITSEVKQKLDDTTRGDQLPEDSILVLYLCKNTEKLHHEVKKTAKKLLPLLDVSKRSDIESSLEEHERMMLETKLKQIDHSEQRVSLDSELTSSDSELHRKLSEVEKKLTKSLKPSSKDKSFSSEMDDKVELHDDILEDLEDVKKDLDEKLSETSSLERPLRVKVLVSTLFQKLAVLDLEKKIRDIEKKSFADDTKDLKTLSDNMIENTKRLLVKRKEDLDRIADELTERISLVIKSIEEKSMLPPDVSDKLRTLFKIKLDQIKLLEDLHRKLHQEDLKEDHESIKDIFEKVKEVSKKIKDILSEEIKSEHSLSWESLKCMKLHFKQLVILHKVKEVVDDRIHKMAVSSDPVLDECKSLRDDVLSQKEEVISTLQKMRLSMMKHGQSIADYNIELSEPFTLPDVLQRVHKIGALHAESRGLHDQLWEPISSKSDSDSVYEEPSTMEHKKILYDIIDKLQRSQDELEKIHEHLDSVKDHPDKDRLEDAIREVKDKVESQLNTVRSLEDTVLKKSKSDDSLFVPLHDIQKLKDKALRVKYDAERLESEVESRLESKVESRPESSPWLDDSSDDSWDDSRPDSEEVDPDRERPIPSRSDRSVIGVIKTMYGDEKDELPKVVTIRFTARKSVAQLLWELDQSISSKQDKMVSSYLRDRSEPDDPTSKFYKEIKDKLHFFRHADIDIVYEDSLPVEIRKFAWLFHEGTKYTYMNQLELHMPDSTNLKNRVVIQLERSVDNKWVDIMVKTPTETTKMLNIRTPEILRNVSLSDSLEVISSKMLYDLSPPPTCEITPRRIKTLKDKSYEVDLRTHPCKTVLTMDCSPHNSLAITSRPHHEDPEKKVITILTKTRKVEIIPESSSVQVKVDDEVVPDSIKISDKPMKQDVLVTYKERSAEVKIPHMFLSVKSDGRKISIKVPSSYTNKLCGICGTLRPHSSKLQDPQQIKFSDPEALMSTYMVPDQSCDPEPIQNRLGVSEIRTKSTQVRPVSRTLVKTDSVGNAMKTCFSIKPVKKCPPGSVPEGTESQLVPYYCTKSSSSKTKRYLDIVSKRVLDEIRKQRTDMKDNVQVPTSCKRL